MRIAVITGASSGLGRTFAGQIDKTEKEIDEIWLIARRKERLEEVADSLVHPARVLPMDLTSEKHIAELEQKLADLSQELKEKGDHLQVGLFVNCAGYAKIGNYEKISRFDSVNMVDLNCKAAVNMTLLMVPYMQARDRIIHICSTAAFQPLQHLNIYAASKSFLYNYTRALRMELLPRQIMVTAVCPWWVNDTEFISVASDNEENADVKASVGGFPGAGKRDRVVAMALRDSKIGLAVSTPSVLSTLHRFFAKILPRTFMLYFWELFRHL